MNQMYDWTRLVAILGTELFVAILFYFLAYRLLSRNKNDLTMTFSGCYISIATGFLINILYLPLTGIIVRILNILSIFLVIFGLVFILLSLLNIWKIPFNKKPFQIFFLLIYAIGLLAFLIFSEGYVISEDTDWRPIFYPQFYFSLVLLTVITITGPSLFIAAYLYTRLKEDFLKKRWKLFLIGYTGFLITFYEFLSYNVVAFKDFRPIFLLISFLVFPSGILVYYGVVRQL